MQLIQFVHERALEDSVLAGAVDPPDSHLIHSSHLAQRLVAHCGGSQERLSPRQHELMLRIADLHQRHGDYDPGWWDELGVPPRGRNFRE